MRESGEIGALWHWGVAMYRFRWTVVLISALVFAVMAYYAQEVPGLLKDNGFTPRGSDSDIGLTLLERELDFAPSTLTLVYTSDSFNMTGRDATQTILDSLAELKNLPYVANISIIETTRLADRNDIQSVLVELTVSRTEALVKYPEFRSLIAAPEGMKVYVNGGTATLYDVQQATKKDMAKSELMGLPIALIVLLLIFGTLWAALLPLIAGVMSVAITLGITYFIAQSYSLSNFMPSMVTMVGLAVGIDYALFVVSRFRDELKRQRSVSKAVARTSGTAGKSILFSGFAVLIGMLGMLFIDLPVMRSLCLGGVLVVLTSVIVSNTLLLALLGIFGRRIDSFRVFPAFQRRRANSSLWERLAFAVMKRPVFLALPMSAVLIALTLPVGNMKLGVPTADVLPPSYESRQGADLLKQTYDAREANPIQIVVQAPGDVWEEDTIRDIRDYSDRIKEVHGVNYVESYITALGDHPPEVTAGLLESGRARRQMEDRKLAKRHTAVLVVVPESDPESAGTATLIGKIRSLDSGSLDALVTGSTAYRIDMMDRINNGLPALLAFVMAVTYVVLLFAFKSVLLPLKAVLMNVLSLGASLGIAVAVFQHGWMADALNITSIGYVSIILPVTIFCVVFGISMDYEVFLISRIMEEYERTGDNDRSTAEGIKKTGGVITSAAFILMVVVGFFIFTDIEITKALGVGLFCAIFIDATFIRMIIVPALMKLLGPANWWAPRWIAGR
ncbi:MMPL family transporter [Paenibacillus alkalitolerans]|uniref:MMPL family transporter n=1 Tax=Paenibacillus alkalitolerans TaxID=2799335 RepID=UPI0018F62965|nr:MMPL family transporter [Paenibacillus alkalitolerans]